LVPAAGSVKVWVNLLNEPEHPPSVPFSRESGASGRVFFAVGRERCESNFFECLTKMYKDQLCIEVEMRRGDSTIKYSVRNTEVIPGARNAIAINFNISGHQDECKKMF
jgi:hypothetical protein